MSIREITDNINWWLVKAQKLHVPIFAVLRLPHTFKELAQWSYYDEKMWEDSSTMNLMIHMPKKGPLNPLNEFLLGLLHLLSCLMSSGMCPLQTECSIHIIKFPVSFSIKYINTLSLEVLLLFVICLSMLHCVK